MSEELKRTQCAKCPWKVSTDPFEIPNGYDADKHRALGGTICMDPLVSMLTLELRIMTCHETDSDPCVGWLANQLGTGNNLGLRMDVIAGRVNGNIETVGEQHETFEDTLPKEGGR